MEEFNIPSPERVVVLRDLQEAMGDGPPVFWAACQICDLESLKVLVQVAKISPAILHPLASNMISSILYWTQSPQGGSRGSTPQKSIKRSINSSPANDSRADPSPAVLNRDKMASRLAKERDGDRCVLTGNSIVEVAHIYPFFSIKNKEDNPFGARHIFWNLLKNFWPIEKVASWEKEIFPTGIEDVGSELASNLITLSRDVHTSWNKGAFALKPISLSDDNKTLTIQFYWQRPQTTTQQPISLLTTPNSTEGLAGTIGVFPGEIKLYNLYTDKGISSGDVFELKTTDIVAKPLPSIKLLELQWFLNRVVGMAGAAEPYEVQDWPDYDSDELRYGVGVAATTEPLNIEDWLEHPSISDPGLSDVGENSIQLPDSVLGSPQSVHPKSMLIPTGISTEKTIGEAEADEESMLIAIKQ